MTRAKTTPRFRISGLLVLLALAAFIGLSREGTAAGPSPVRITVTDSKDPVASGEQLTYTMLVENTGGAKVSNVVLTNQLNGLGGIGVPPMYQLTSDPTKVCTQNSNLVTCNGGDMAGFSSWTVTVRGVVTASNGTVMNNTAQVTGTKSAQTFTVADTELTDVANAGPPPVLQPELSINKTGPTSVAPSANFDYILTVYNNGTANADNIRVVDTLPAGVTVANANTTGIEETSLFVCTMAGQTVTCDGGSLTAGANATITIHATAPAAEGPITNTASVDPNNTIAESNELNNVSANVNTNVGAPPPPPDNRLEIAKSGPEIVVPGQRVTYTIVVTNPSPFRSDYNTMVDGTQGLEATSIIASQSVVGGTIGNGYGCTVLAAQVKCEIFKLEKNGVWTITYEGTVIASAGSTILNTASVNGNIKNNGVTATTTFQTTVRPAIDLSVTKADQPDPVCARSWPTQSLDSGTPPPPAAIIVPPLVGAPGCLGGLLYTFVIGNSGINGATGVVLRDPLPAGTVYDSYEDTSGAGFACELDPAGETVPNTVVCSGGTIGAASTATVKILVVAPPTTGSITNTVYIDPYNAIFEADELNNTYTISTGVATGIDLAIVKYDAPIDPPGATNITDGFDPIATNGTQTYTIIVDNLGPQNATGIKVRDVLPDDTVFLETEQDNGFTCTYLIGPHIVECVGGSLLGTADEFYPPFGAPGDDFAVIKIRVFAQPFVGQMLNEVRVDPFNEIAEYNEENNFEFETTTVTTGNSDVSAFNQLRITKTQTSPDPAVDATVATSGTLIYDIKVDNLGTDPVSAIVVKDFLPSGSIFIEAKDTDAGPDVTDAFFCSHAAGVITCTGGALSGSINTIAGVPTTRNITVKVFAPAVPGDYINLAKVDPDGLIPEGNEFDNESQVTTPVRIAGNNPFNELTVTKTQVTPAGNAVALSSVVTWNVVVTNTGTDPAFNVTLTDTLPAGFTLISALDTGGPADPLKFVCLPGAGNTINCSGATLDGSLDLAPGPIERTIVVKAFSSAVPGDYTNTVFVDPGNSIPESNEANNAAISTVAVSNGGPGPWIDLSVDKVQIAPDPGTIDHVVPGGQIEYRLIVTNSGEATAFNVTVRDVLPSHVLFHNALDLESFPEPPPGATGLFTCNEAAGVLDCTGGTIPPGGTRTIVVQVLAPEAIEHIVADLSNVQIRLTNQATTDPLNTIAEGNEANNFDAVHTTVRSEVNLTLEKDGPESASQNQEVQYTITVKNNLPVAGDTGSVATGVKIVDPLPTGLIVLGVQATGNFTCQVFENPVNFVECTGDLEPDTEVTITIDAFVTADGGTLDNEACVDPDHAIAETNEVDNCDHVFGVVVPPAPALNINKSASSGTVTPGQTLDYTVTVSNTGTAPATNVNIEDTLPSAVTFVSAIATNGYTCADPVASVIVCTGPDLQPGASVVVTIQTTVNAGVTESFTNGAGATADSVAEVNASVTTNVGGAAVEIVLVDITDLPDPLAVGSALTYTIIVANAGTSDATGLDITQVFDDLDGLTYSSGVGSQGFTCSLASVTVTCTGNLAAGQSTILTIVFETAAGAVGDVNSTVTADSGLEFAEIDELNNIGTEVTTISADICQDCIDLVLGGVSASPDPVADQEDVVINFHVVNVGDLSTASDDAPNAVLVTIDVDGDFNDYSAISVNLPDFTCNVTLFPAAGLPEVVCSKASLGPGEGTVGSVTVTIDNDPPFITADLAVDLIGDITEFNEFNNSGFVFITVDTP